jgi:Undecaprenyl-phosphate glucose phosphotransferase
MLRVDPKQAVEDHVAKSRRKRARGVKLSDLAEAIIARPTEKTYSSAVITGLVQLVEAALLAAIGGLIYLAYVTGVPNGFYALVIIGAVLVANILFNLAQTHRIGAYRTRFKQIGRVLAAWSIVFVVITLGAFFFKVSDLVSRVWMVSWYLLGGVFLIGFRLGVRALINRWTQQGKLKRRTVIVGGGKDSEALIKAITTGAGNDIELFGLFDDRVDERSPDQVAGCPKLGNVSDLVEFARRTQVDLVIVSMPLSAEKRVLAMLKQLWVLPVDIRLSAHMSQLKFKANAYSYVGDVPVFDMADRPISDWSLVFKWTFDKLVALTALILLSPIMIITAIAVKLESPGPVFFKQRRHGFNNEFIDIYKFRSMYHDQADATASKQVSRGGDARVTRVGKFIRKTSIDELPQLFNVLKNEISVVGPRPHAVQAKAANKLYNEAVDGYFARHKVKPGMTGWAQIHGWRGETDTVDKIMNRVNHDLYYIENWTPFLDFYIVMMTPFSLFAHRENAF